MNKFSLLVEQFEINDEIHRTHRNADPMAAKAVGPRFINWSDRLLLRALNNIGENALDSMWRKAGIAWE